MKSQGTISLSTDGRVSNHISVDLSSRLCYGVERHFMVI